jgi:ATP-binding cassette subfamily C protein CydCD
VVVVAGDSESDLQSLDLESWRQRVSWLPQRAQLPAARLAERPTLREALGLRGEVADAALWQALETAGLAEEIRSRPDGLDTRLDADGGGLSVGQMRRLTLARALVSPSDVVLLDEPTAALDPASEQAVVDAVRGLATAGATVIVVAHRPALLEAADQVLRLEAAVAERDAAALAVAEEAATSVRRTVGSEGW